MVASAAKGFSYLVGLQLFSRIITFALNTLLARDLGPQWYAIANVPKWQVHGWKLWRSAAARHSLATSYSRTAPVGARVVESHTSPQRTAVVLTPRGATVALKAGSGQVTKGSSAAV